MPKVSHQTMTIARAQNAAPSLKYIALYGVDEVYVNSCMRRYENRSFVYLLTSDYSEKEVCIYVGKTKSQYSRFLSHIKKFEFDHIYLFECDPGELSDNEALIIREFKPLYNRRHNPLELRYRQILNIDYDKPQTKENIQHNLCLKEQYEHYGLFGFSLNPVIYCVLEKEADKNHCNCSEMLQLILERYYSTEIATNLQAAEEFPQTNLATTIEYAKSHGCSRESIKQFLREENRICGAKQIGRDWILPKDSHFPEDRRKKCQTKNT